jgi:dGTPase
VTQVVAVNELQLFHNRLTHTMKVAQLARRLAHDLVEDQQNGAALAARSLDPDAAEAAALAHDLGHPPFGHIAEEVLNEKCNAWG